VTDETVLVDIMTRIVENYGFLVGFLAAMGFCALVNSALRISLPLLQFVGIVFIATPVIFVRSVTGKDDSIKNEFSEIMEYAKRNPREAKSVLFYTIGSFAGIILIALIYQKVLL